MSSAREEEYSNREQPDGVDEVSEEWAESPSAHPANGVATEEPRVAGDAERDDSGEEGGGGEAAEDGEEAEGGQASAADGEPDDPVHQAELWRDEAARARAELENYRKRMTRERAEAIQYANRQLLEHLLPIVDNFEMGLKAAHDAEGDSSMIYQGMAMVRKQFDDFLSSQGVERIESDGLAFDPNVHEAVRQEPHDTIPEGEIIQTVRPGYRLRDRLLRAASVVVSAGPKND